jgi:fibronectin-binding autotransporter adhesin
MTYIRDGATLALQGGVSLDEHFHAAGNGVGGLGAVRSISGNNALTLLDGSGNGALGIDTNITVGVDADTLTATGFYHDSGSYGITKVGAGTLVLSDKSRYTGATQVNAGNLIVNGNISTSSLTTVKSGASLGGSGTVGALTVLNGATLAPGNSPGTLTVGGTLGLENLSILSFELNPTDTTVGGGINDLITGVTGLTLDGLLNVTACTGSFAGVTSGTWRLFDYSGSLTNNNLTLNTMPALDYGYSWFLDTATANQVNLTIVPEPGAVLLGGLGMLALLRRRR